MSKDDSSDRQSPPFRYGESGYFSGKPWGRNNTPSAPIGSSTEVDAAEDHAATAQTTKRLAAEEFLKLADKLVPMDELSPPTAMGVFPEEGIPHLPGGRSYAGKFS